MNFQIAGVGLRDATGPTGGYGIVNERYGSSAAYQDTFRDKIR